MFGSTNCEGKYKNGWHTKMKDSAINESQRSCGVDSGVRKCRGR